MPNHESEFEERECQLIDIPDAKWIWPKEDRGGWDGPTGDWNQAHHKEYFRFVKKYDVVVTAGANCGLHARGYAQKFKGVYAFEPDYKNFYCLTRNCVYPNVFKFHAALGKEAGFCNLRRNKTNWGAFAIDTNTNNQAPQIPMMTIDSLNLWACDLIQLDVEGWESDVIRGAINTIEKYKPVLITEKAGNEISDLLNGFGYNGHTRSKMDTIHTIKDIHET
jgi:FkbM family methyltransferase